MSSNFEDSVSDFDLYLLKPSTKNVGTQGKIKKLREDIHLLKKKTIATNSLIEKYISKSELLQQTEKCLVDAKEEYKRTLIDYSEAMEKCSKNEKEVQSLSIQNKELQERLIISDNQYKGIKSHANQLQMLIRQYQTQIESLKIEKNLGQENLKRQTKSKVTQIKEYDVLLRDICFLRDTVLGKKRAPQRLKKLLKKYEKHETTVDSEDDSISEISVKEMDSWASLCPDTLCQKNNIQAKTLSQTNLHNNLDKEINNVNNIVKLTFGGGRIDDDLHSDSGNDVISEDTGCGSSFSCSDVEKCYSSPDYFRNDSPFSSLTQREHKIFVETATSPITVTEERMEVATSPIIFDNDTSNHEILSNFKSTQDVGVAADPSDFISMKNISTNTETKFLLDKSTSPVHFQPIVNTLTPCISKNLQERSTSPIQFNQIITIEQCVTKKQDMSTSPVQFNKSVKSTGTNTMKYNQSNVATSPIHFDSEKPAFENFSNERECLKANNSITLNDNEPDCEIETILSNMRLDHELITPIPKSPVNCPIQQYNHNCQAVSKAVAENKELKVTVDDLTKEILNIKYLLKNHLHLSEQELNNSDQVCDDINICSTVPVNTSSENNLSSSQKDASETFDPVTNTKQTTPNITKQLFIDETQNNVENVNIIQNRNEQFDRDCLVSKSKKLTRLEKLRIKLTPKSKIQRATTPIRKVERKTFMINEKILDQCTKSLQDNKLAYENAVKVMTEIRDREKNKSMKKTVVSGCRQELQTCDHIDKGFKNHCNHLKTPTKLSISCNLDVQKVVTTNCTDSPKIESSQKLDVSPLSYKESSITTRSRSKRLSSELSTDSVSNSFNRPSVLLERKENECKQSEVTLSRKRRKSSPALSDSNNLEHNPKRLLRSSVSLQTSNIDDDAVNNETTCNKPFDQTSPIVNNKRRSGGLSISHKNEVIDETNSKMPKGGIVTYIDLDIFSDKSLSEISKDSTVAPEKIHHPKGSLLCKMLEKYGKCTVKSRSEKRHGPNINLILQQIEEGIAHISTVPHTETKQAISDFLNKIRNIDKSCLIAAFVKYLKDPARKCELFKKVLTPPAPPMTKYEQVLICVIKQIQTSSTCSNFIESMLANIEFALFQLNHTPDFDAVESLSHFYAVLCRYLGAKSRLRLFILDAMYCIQFKSVVLIKQCLEVWMHVLPLAHMGIAKTPLVTCLVYLLHFFKCEDKLNRVQEIRNILSNKYFYQVKEWSEADVLEMFRNAINEIRDVPIENKMLRMSLIILAKRRGPQWTQKNIVKNILQPFIEKDQTREKVKEFCILVLGPLLKPYPNDMKVHCAVVVNQLSQMLDSNVTPLMKEAIISSLIFMKRHNENRVTQALLTWNPEKISPELELLLKEYVREKPAKVWKKILSRISVIESFKA